MNSEELEQTLKTALAPGAEMAPAMRLMASTLVSLSKQIEAQSAAMVEMETRIESLERGGMTAVAG